MERTVKDLNILEKFATQFCRVVDAHAKYMIVSGFVAIISGRIRGTEDIDLIIEPLDAQTFSKLHHDLCTHGFEAIQSSSPDVLLEYLTDKTSIQYCWLDKPLPVMELKFAKDDLDRMQLHERVRLPLTTLDLWFSSIEWNIAFKEEYLQSEKDMDDAHHLRKIYTVDEQKIKEYKVLVRRYRL